MALQHTDNEDLYTIHTRLRGYTSEHDFPVLPGSNKLMAKMCEINFHFMNCIVRPSGMTFTKHQ